jgi:hypothetical protein
VIKQHVVVAKPDDDINILGVPGHVITLSGGTVVTVLAGHTAPEDHDDIVGAIVKLLAICAGTGVDPEHTAERIKAALPVAGDQPGE